mgnify:CR=1 FL=1
MLQEGQARRYGFLHVAWGFISDVDFDSEVYRWMGGMRFTVTAVEKIVLHLSSLFIVIFISIYVAQGNSVSREDLIHPGTRSARTALWQWVSSVLPVSAVLRIHRKEGPRTVDTRKRTPEDLGESGGGRRTAGRTQERGGE